MCVFILVRLVCLICFVCLCVCVAVDVCVCLFKRSCAYVFACVVVRRSFVRLFCNVVARELRVIVCVCV